MLTVMSECFSLVMNLKQQKPAIIPAWRASAVLRLSPKCYTVTDVEDHKTIISNCSSVTYKTSAWLPCEKDKVINYMGVKRGLSQ